MQGSPGARAQTGLRLLEIDCKNGVQEYEAAFYHRVPAADTKTRPHEADLDIVADSKGVCCPFIRF